MIVVVAADTAELLEPEVFTALSVRSTLSGADLGAAVDRQRLGRTDPDGAHVWLDPAVLQAEPGEPSAGLVGMLAFAASRGWTDGEGRVRAHVEARPSAE